MKEQFTNATITTVRTIRGKVDSVDYNTYPCEKTLDEIVKISKENKNFYVIDLPHERVKVVKIEKYPCLFEDLKGNKKTKIIKQETIYIFS